MADRRHGSGFRTKFVRDATSREKLADAMQKVEQFKKAVRHLTLHNTNLEASNESLKYAIGDLEVNNDFARFETESVNHPVHKYQLAKVRYLSPKTAKYTMAQEQIREDPWISISAELGITGLYFNILKIYLFSTGLRRAETRNLLAREKRRDSPVLLRDYARNTLSLY